MNASMYKYRKFHLTYNCRTLSLYRLKFGMLFLQIHHLASSSHPPFEHNPAFQLFP